MAEKRGSYKEKINKLTLGLFDSLIDSCLFVLFFHLQAYKIGYGKKSLSDAIDEAIHLTKIVHANSLDRVIYKAKTKGYLEKKEDYIKITKLGMKRLAGVLPHYDKERPWDGKLYLITYDIPEVRKRERDYLRSFLKTIGCGLLQYSVWLTPYNPKRLIADFVKERKLVGLVLVSELKEGSAIGGKDILTVLEKVYRLDQLNEEYKKFVKKIEGKKLTGTQLAMTYLSILKKDPQIPFELLPRNWWGEDAYEEYNEAIEGIGKERKNPS